jgi:hypothetical protein
MLYKNGPDVKLFLFGGLEAGIDAISPLVHIYDPRSLRRELSLARRRLDTAENHSSILPLPSARGGAGGVPQKPQSSPCRRQGEAQVGFPKNHFGTSRPYFPGKAKNSRLLFDKKTRPKSEKPYFRIQDIN